MNDEHRVDALLKALEAEGILLDHAAAERVTHQVITAHRRLNPVKPVDRHLGWIYDTHAETIAAADLAIEQARPTIPNLDLRTRMGNIASTLADHYGIDMDDVMRAYNHLRRGNYVTYPTGEPEMIEYEVLADQALDAPIHG